MAFSNNLPDSLLASQDQSISSSIVCQVPPPLVPGDLLCVIAPSGGLQSSEAFEEGLDVWRSRGYRLQLMTGYDARWGYLAGKDEARRQQLMSALTMPECKGILCARGGYGGTRLLENWTWPFLAQTGPNQPFLDQSPVEQKNAAVKWLIGFSDITSLLWSLSNQGISGVHGPVLTTLSDEPPQSVERLFNWVEKHEITPLYGKGWIGKEGAFNSAGQANVSSQATGILLPGNLCVATHLLGTSAEPTILSKSDLTGPDLSEPNSTEPNSTGVILAFEDVGEAPYRLDRMLTQWRSMGKLANVKGIALGRFSGWEPTKDVPTLSVEAVMRDRLSDLNIPIVSDLPFGHDGENAALPVGLPVRLDAARGELSWLSSLKVAV